MGNIPERKKLEDCVVTKDQIKASHQPITKEELTNILTNTGQSPAITKDDLYVAFTDPSVFDGVMSKYISEEQVESIGGKSSALYKSFQQIIKSVILYRVSHKNNPIATKDPLEYDGKPLGIVAVLMHLPNITSDQFEVSIQILQSMMEDEIIDRSHLSIQTISVDGKDYTYLEVAQIFVYISRSEIDNSALTTALQNQYKSKWSTMGNVGAAQKIVQFVHDLLSGHKTETLLSQKQWREKNKYPGDWSLSSAYIWGKQNS